MPKVTTKESLPLNTAQERAFSRKRVRGFIEKAHLRASRHVWRVNDIEAIHDFLEEALAGSKLVRQALRRGATIA